ncbi:diaminopimelate decarboxylase [Fundicoccus culcitae]|uniref:Diaminopimelate decarboxylase n=1 Tax=Fundicoccus culcitae TaxID=2969821 RepID=A0ABY5P646_9LACT|nr:diaminopimelate decarboxylase [Fundicoccus culcitae]UUX34051.1 diaminopimelate decarboxylase [Fundicoccus culcitae]
MKLESYQTIVNGQLQHDGLSYQYLAETYGTPLYIFDETTFVQRVKDYKEALSNPYFETEVLFASKALLTKAMGQLVAQLGIGQDVVSAGEIYTAVASGVNPSKLYFHGNNKLNDELLYAIEQGVGTIVLDNRSEASRLNKLLLDLGKKQRVLLRLNPGVEAHTHEYIKTAHNDSKFGESVFDPAIEDVIQTINNYPTLDLAGFHCHIGSQVFEEQSFLDSATEMIEFSKKMEDNLNLKVKEINFGGGFGVYYTAEDKPFDIKAFLPKFIQHVHETSQKLSLTLEKVTIEPGRALVNQSGSTLYRVGDLKTTTSGKNYLFVDGGMTDNIRPALYQAKYEALITNKADEVADTVYTIAGKACESGDKIINDYPLPEAETGDLLLVNGTGAYNYTMSSHYNRIPKPAMIHVLNGKSRLTVKRETFADMMRNEI